MNIGSDLSVYQYEIIIEPEVMFDSFISNMIFRSIQKRIESLLGLVVLAGKTLFTPTDLNETLVIETKYNDIQYSVTINADSKTYFSGK